MRKLGMTPTDDLCSIFHAALRAQIEGARGHMNIPANLLKLMLLFSF